MTVPPLTPIPALTLVAVSERNGIWGIKPYTHRKDLKTFFKLGS